MAKRTLTIEPFELPDGSFPETDVVISLVDENDNRIQGIVTADGQPIIDRIEVPIHRRSYTVDIHPQPDLAPILNHGTEARTTTSYYLVEVIRRRTRYRHRFRTQVASGGDLSWAEFVSGAGPVDGGTLPIWMEHIDDAGVHVPSGGLTDQVLSKRSDSDGDTVWSTGGAGAHPITLVSHTVGPGEDFEGVKEALAYLVQQADTSSGMDSRNVTHEFLVKDGTYLLDEAIQVRNVSSFIFRAENPGSVIWNKLTNESFNYIRFSNVAQIVFEGIDFHKDPVGGGEGYQFESCIVHFKTCAMSDLSTFAWLLRSTCHVSDGFSAAAGPGGIGIFVATHGSQISFDAFSGIIDLDCGGAFNGIRVMNDAIAELFGNQSFSVTDCVYGLVATDLARINVFGTVEFDDISVDAVRAENFASILMAAPPTFGTVGSNYSPNLNLFKGPSYVLDSNGGYDAEFNTVRGTLKNYGETDNDLGDVAGSVSLSLADGHVHYGTMIGATTFTLANPAGHASASLSLLVATGGFTATFPGVVWPGGAPDLGADATYLLSFLLVNGVWYGQG